MTTLLLRLAYYIPLSLRNAIPHRVQRIVKTALQKKQLSNWQAEGCPPPPPHLIKVSAIIQAAKQHRLPVFIETGTFMGDMLDSVRLHFLQLHSIELQPNFAKRAQRIFSNDAHIHVHTGDSAKVLPKLLKLLKSPAIFWLDAHYSGGDTARAAIDTPIEAELRAIFTHTIRRHAILIDDARLFIGEDGYPTLKRLKSFCKKMAPHYNFIIEHDCIKLLPRVGKK